MNLRQPVDRAEIRGTTSYWEAGDSRAIEDTTVGEAPRRVPTGVGARVRTCSVGPNAWPGRFRGGSIRAKDVPERVILEYAATLPGVTVNPAPRAGELRYVLGHSRGRMAGVPAGVWSDRPNPRETASFPERDAFVGEGGRCRRCDRTTRPGSRTPRPPRGLP